MNEFKCEIRKILNGRYSFVPGTEYIEAGDSVFDVQGINNGLISSYIFGVTSYKKKFRSVSEGKKLSEISENALRKMGLLIKLKNAPDIFGIYSSRTMHNPFIITAEYEGEEVTMTFYTARTIMARINAWSAFGNWNFVIHHAAATPKIAFSGTTISVTISVNLIADSASGCVIDAR